MSKPDFIRWITGLPENLKAAPIQSAVGPWPSGAKRIIAYEYKDGSGIGIVVNSMGTHLSDDWYKSVNVISIFEP